MDKAIMLRVLPALASLLGLVMMAWGFALNLSGHESAQSWSLIGVGAGTFGSGGVSWQWRRGRRTK